MELCYDLIEMYVKRIATDEARINMWNAYCNALGHTRYVIHRMPDFNSVMEDSGYTHYGAVILACKSDEFKPLDSYWWFELSDTPPYSLTLRSTSNIYDTPIDVEAMLGWMWDEGDDLGDTYVSVLLSRSDLAKTEKELIFSLLHTIVKHERG